MRLTCLHCGHQVEVSTSASPARISCVCGKDYTSPSIVNTGTRPNERAAERSRSRAFRAAGLVQNFGGFALGVSLLGILFFPVALVGAVIGVYVLTMLRGPAGRYSGREQAIAAVAIGVLVFVAEGSLAWSWYRASQRRHLSAIQDGAADELRTLLRAERLYRAQTDTFGTFTEIRFRRRYASHTLYLASDDVLVGERAGVPVAEPLPEGLFPGVSEHSFTAVAVANLDDDPALDVWLLRASGEVLHLVDDVDAEELATVVIPPPPPGEVVPGVEDAPHESPAPPPAQRESPAPPPAQREVAPPAVDALVPAPAPHETSAAPVTRGEPPPPGPTIAPPAPDATAAPAPGEVSPPDPVPTVLDPSAPAP